MSRILVVSSYPPIRDGIGQYAVQEVQRLQDAGHDVEVLSPAPSAAHHHLRLASIRGPLALAKRVRRYDDVIVQYQTDLFFPPGASALERAAISVGLIVAVVAAHRFELRVHEFDLEGGTRRRIDGWMARLFWLLADGISVHTTAERDRLCAAYGIDPGRVELVDHGRSFVRRTTATKDEARQTLGLPADEVVFVSIGFIQWHKGFHRSVTAFASLGHEGCRLDIVGSLRVEDGLFVEYADLLAQMVDRTPGAYLHTGYLSDEAFDLWLVAADAVVLPYEHIWSSGVIERAALYGTPVIATAVGGLEEQAGEGTELVRDDIELLVAMRRLAADRGATPTSGDHAPWPEEIDRESLQLAVESAAAREPDLPDLSPEGRSALFASGQANLTTMHPLRLPRPDSIKGSSRLVKSAVQALTRWQLDPVVDRVNRLHEAVVEARGERWQAAERARLRRRDPTGTGSAD